MLKPYSVPIYRVTLVREGGISSTDMPQFRSSIDVAKILQIWFADADREQFVVVLLNRKNRLIGINSVAAGSLDGAMVHPREVFKPAILSNAAAIIIAHNHPSGECTPSKEDLAITRRLVEVGKLHGIGVLDHIIIGEGTYLSMADDNLLGD